MKLLLNLWEQKQKTMTTTLTAGQQIGASVSPFMTSKHTVPKNECIEMVAKPIDRIIDELISELKATEDLLINLCNERRPFDKRLQRVRTLIKKYSK